MRHAVAHFLSGTSCLCRPMMDHALDQLDAATEVIEKLVPALRHANLDTFEFDLRVSMLIMYDQPDQWRIRSLRIVMGKLMAVCFPLILQSRRWESVYELLWGILRIRVVADHSTSPPTPQDFPLTQSLTEAFDRVAFPGRPVSQKRCHPGRFRAHGPPLDQISWPQLAAQ